MLEPCALSHLRALFRVGAWCSDPGTHEFQFCVGVQILVLCVLSHCVSVCVCVCVCVWYVCVCVCVCVCGMCVCVCVCGMCV